MLATRTRHLHFADHALRISSNFDQLNRSFNSKLMRFAHSQTESLHASFGRSHLDACTPMAEGMAGPESPSRWEHLLGDVARRTRRLRTSISRLNY